jgi:nitrile hydratase beta subunit
VNGAQDLGGMMGFGGVEPEPDGVVFHADWERRAFGITMAMGATGVWNLDAMRHARESLHPAEYLGSSYYAIWLRALERMVVAHALVSRDEVRTGHAMTAPAARPPMLKSHQVPALLARGTPFERAAREPARFAVGDRVVTRNMHPPGHTRLPRYARGKRGAIELRHGVFAFPDSNAHGAGESPQWLYTVRFSARELWGEDADPTVVVSIAAWESYLESA